MNNDYQIKKNGTFSNLSGKGKVFFFVQIVGVFAISFVILYVIGLVPKELRSSDPVSFDNMPDVVDHGDVDNVEVRPQTQTRPERIVINKLGLDTAIGQPSSQNIGILDQFLARGVVHYPGSGMLEEGNIFLFGHSADRYQLVTNEALKVFNGLSKLENGDEITLVGNGKQYVYSIDSVNLVNADTAFVDFTKNGQTLTLSTCNTFGAQQERWVVEATLKTVRS